MSFEGRSQAALPLQPLGGQHQIQGGLSNKPLDRALRLFSPYRHCMWGELPGWRPGVRPIGPIRPPCRKAVCGMKFIHPWCIKTVYGPGWHFLRMNRMLRRPSYRRSKHMPFRVLSIPSLEKGSVGERLHPPVTKQARRHIHSVCDSLTPVRRCSHFVFPHYQHQRCFSRESNRF